MRDKSIFQNSQKNNKIQKSNDVLAFESDDFTSANARTLKEAQKLVEAGFEYVCDFDGDKLFRKRK